MKFRIYGMVFVLGVVFSLALEASAHEYKDYKHDDVPGTTAEDVAEAGVDNEAEMRKFLNHRVEHLDLIEDDNNLDDSQRLAEVAILSRRFREEGAFKHRESNVYTLGVRTVGAKGFITNHALYPGLLGNEVDLEAGGPLAGTLKALTDGAGVGTTDCEEYQLGGMNRVACATKTVVRGIGEVALVVGLHHAEDDAAISLPDCSEFSLDTGAKEVFDAQTEEESLEKLEAYVKSVIAAAQSGTKRIADQVLADDPELAGRLRNPATQLAAGPELIQRVIEKTLEKTACFSSEEHGFKHGNIYAFMMNPDDRATVFLNGNNSDLNGLDLDVDDVNLEGDEKSIAKLFRNELTKGEDRAPRAGDYAIVRYRWDDPLDDTDNPNPNWLEDGAVPGISPKISYIEVMKSFEEVNPLIPTLLIVGSGIYPDVDNVPDMMAGDGGDGSGCAIAGAENKSQSTLLNLLLTASVLFSIVFLRRRA